MTLSRIASAALLAAALALPACGDKRPTAPGSTSGPVSAGNLPIGTVRIEGPGTVAPGGTVVYRLLEQRSDLTWSPLTEGVTWTSSNREVLTVSASGEAAALFNGLTRLQARGTRNGTTREAQMDVIVTPTHTFRLSGTVRETDGQPMTGVDVRLRSGGVDLQRTKTSNGFFEFYGVPSRIDVHAEHVGYQPGVQPMTLTAHETMSIVLRRADPIPDISGRYTLTVEASPCASGTAPALPTELRRRSYSAEVTQSGSDVQVTLGGAEFAPRYTALANTFEGRLQGTVATFYLYGKDSFYYDYDPNPSVAERLSDDRFLVTSGFATTTITPHLIAGRLSGSMRLLSAVPHGLQEAVCSGTLTLTLRR